jgi:hypothetical protein
MINVTVQPQTGVLVKTGGVARASNVAFTSESGGLSSTNIQGALQELTQRKFASSTTPISSYTDVGDLWFDSADTRLKIYDGSDWALILGGATDIQDNYFKFTTATTLVSGNVAEYVNGTETVFAVNFEGVTVLKEQGTVPTVVTNGLYSDGDNLYYGKNDN